MPLRDQGGQIYGHVQNESGWSSVYSGDTYTDPDQWIHVALTYSPGSLKLYVDGQLKNETSGVFGNIVNNDRKLYLGRYHSYDNYFKGNIDEVVVIWKRELDQNEINQKRFTKLFVDQELDLKAYWRMEKDLPGNGTGFEW